MTSVGPSLCWLLLRPLLLPVIFTTPSESSKSTQNCCGVPPHSPPPHPAPPFSNHKTFRSQPTSKVLLTGIWRLTVEANGDHAMNAHRGMLPSAAPASTHTSATHPPPSPTKSIQEPAQGTKHQPLVLQMALHRLLQQIPMVTQIPVPKPRVLQARCQQQCERRPVVLHALPLPLPMAPNDLF